MAQWKIDKYVYEKDLFDVNLDFSPIEDDLYDFLDRKTGMFKLRKCINMSIYLSIFISKDLKIKRFDLDINSIFDSTKYSFEAEEFKKIYDLMKKVDEDESITINVIKNYFSQYEELSFLSLIDEAGAIRL